MRYIKRDIEAIDVFAVFLCLLGIFFLVWSVRSYNVDPRYLPRMIGASKPFVQQNAAILGGLFFGMSVALNAAIRRGPLLRAGESER